MVVRKIEPTASGWGVRRVRILIGFAGGLPVIFVGRPVRRSTKVGWLGSVWCIVGVERNGAGVGRARVRVARWSAESLLVQNQA